MPCDGAGDACMGLAWSMNTDSPRLALSGTSGKLYVGELSLAGGGGELRPIAEWQGHDLEGWAVAFDPVDHQTLYSGADDAILKRWDLRCCCSDSNEVAAAASSTFAEDDAAAEEGREAPMMTASNRKSHGAGVCCISPCAARPHLIATGSYDETARLWDVRQLRAPLCSAPCGGGVWRLKWHVDESGGPPLLLAACMHAGFAVLRASGLPGGGVAEGENGGAAEGTPELEPVATYCAHGLGAGGLGYGADWASLRHEGGGRGVPLVGATCSFYDRQLHLWELELG